MQAKVPSAFVPAPGFAASTTAVASASMAVGAAANAVPAPEGPEVSTGQCSD